VDILIEATLESYNRNGDANAILAKLKGVRKRGRKREMIG
jgi:tRNA A-37 threonylcarbamoyl transferase component Bud32